MSREPYLVDGLSSYYAFFYHTQRDPEWLWLSDATLSAVVVFCAETAVWWRYDLTTEENSRSMMGAKCPKRDAI